MQFKRDVFLVAICVFAMLPVVGNAQNEEASYQIKPGDILSVSVWGEEELRGTALVTPDGSFSFPLVGHVNARGMTAEQVQDIVRRRLLTYLSEPVVTVSLQEINGNTI